MEVDPHRVGGPRYRRYTSPMKPSVYFDIPENAFYTTCPVASCKAKPGRLCNTALGASHRARFVRWTQVWTHPERYFGRKI